MHEQMSAQTLTFSGSLTPEPYIQQLLMNETIAYIHILMKNMQIELRLLLNTK